MKKQQVQSEVVKANTIFGYKRTFKCNSVAEANKLFNDMVSEQKKLSETVKFTTPKV